MALVARPQAGRRHRHAAARRDARGRGIHAPGPRGRARRVLHPRRRDRHLPGGRRPARAHRARRRHHRNDSPIRARHAAVGGDNRAPESRAAARTAGTAAESSAARSERQRPRVPFFDYLGIARRAVVVVSEPDEIRERVEKQLAQIAESYEQDAAAVESVARSPRRRRIAGDPAAAAVPARRLSSSPGPTSSASSPRRSRWRNWGWTMPGLRTRDTDDRRAPAPSPSPRSPAPSPESPIPSPQSQPPPPSPRSPTPAA